METNSPTKSRKIDQVNVQVFPDKNMLGRAAANEIAEALKKAISTHGSANAIVATGASQYEMLEALRSSSGIDWSKVTAFHLDEYVGISEDHPASFRKYLRQRLFNYVNCKEVHFLNGNADDPEKECKRYESLLANSRIDVACVGIGENAHLAFNDPPADFQTKRLVHVVTLDQRCRQQQVGEGHFASVDEVPRQALSLTIPAILKAGYIACCVPDQRKAEAVANCLEKPVSPRYPASALRLHTNTTIYLDNESSSLLGCMKP